MNYFELFDLPISFTINKAQLKKKYYELSRAFHPDHFTNSNEEEQAQILEKAAMVNKGYKVLNNEYETIQYVLLLKSIITIDENYQLPQDFLMDMMDINEALMEATPETIYTIKSTIKSLENELYQTVQPILENDQDNTFSKEGLLQVKEYYFKKKYLDRILDNVMQ